MRRWVFVLSAAALLVVACGRDVQPEAAAEPTRWDPCSITPEAIAATGLDPSYRREGWGKGVVVEDWDLCSFRPPGADFPYGLSVRFTLSHRYSDVRQEWLESDLKDIILGGREAFQYRTASGRSAVSCNIVVDSPPGAVGFAVNYLDYDAGEPDPCTIVLKHATDLQSALPAPAK